VGAKAKEKLKEIPAVRKKKVQPYPIAGTLELNAIKRNVEVVHLTAEGFIAQMVNGMVSVGEYYQVVFELPVSHNFVNSSVRVIKTYDRSVDPKKGTVDRMAEFHFKGLTDGHRQYILAFLSTIGQQ
jgi:hypothetical protein